MLTAGLTVIVLPPFYSQLMSQVKKRVGNVQHRFSTRVAAIIQRRCMFLLLSFSVGSRKYGWILGQNIFVKFPVKVTESIVNFRPV